MKVSFTPSKEDVLNAMRAVPRSTWNVFIFIICMGSLFVIGAYLVDHDMAAFGYSWLAMSLVVSFAMYEIPRFRAQRDLTRNPSAQGEVTYSFDEKGVTVIHPTGDSRLQWSAFTRFRETDALFLLFVSGTSCRAVPKRVMSPDQIAELRKILELRIGAAR